MKMPYMNNVDVTSWSQSQGCPIVRVIMSKLTESEKPNSATPHRIISTSSRLSSARHLRWRCRLSTNFSATPIPTPTAPPVHKAPITAFSPRSVCCPYQCLDFVGVRAETVRELVQIRIGDLLETRFVDDGDDLYAHCLEFRCRLPLQPIRHLGFLCADIAAGSNHPLLLIGTEALPQPIANPEDRIIGFVFAHGKNRRDLVVLVDQIDVYRILGEINDPGLKRGVNAAKRHVHCLCAICV